MNSSELIDTVAGWLKSLSKVQQFQEDIAANRESIFMIRENQSVVLKKLSAIESHCGWVEQQLSNLTSQQELNMAKFSELMDAIESTGVAIIEKVTSETAEVVAALEKAKGGATLDEIQSAIDKVKALGGSVSDAVAGIIPTVTSPTAPTPVEVPAPTPEPVEVPTPAVDPEVPVTIEPSPAGTGVDGGSSVDVAPIAAPVDAPAA